MRTASSAPSLAERPVALVVPHAGWNFSGVAAAAAYRLLGPEDFDRVVVLAPSHHGTFRGFALDDARAYRTPLGEVPLCDGTLESLGGPLARVIPGVSGPEHAVEVGLPFLQAALGDFCLVPVLSGETDGEIQARFAQRLAGLDDGRTLFVASSDFAHYGPRYDFEPFGPLSPASRERIREMDSRAVERLLARDAPGFRASLAETGNTICGGHALGTLMELLQRIGPTATGTVLAHFASSDLPGLDDTSSVTYVSLAYGAASVDQGASAGALPRGSPLLGLPRLEAVPLETPLLDEETGQALVHLARAALESEIAGEDALGPVLAAWPDGPEHERLQGLYVSLYRTSADEIIAHGRLRGCVGQTDPTFPPYFGTVQAALDAALQDDRFRPVNARELEALEVEVAVLSRRRPVASWRDIRLGTHGIVLQKGQKAAVFLPQIPEEQGWSLVETLDALAEKAGLEPQVWREGGRLSVFTAQIFAEGR